MAKTTVLMCSYCIPQPFRGRRFCLNRAKWYVEFRGPDAPGMDRMRAKNYETRCSCHTDSKFFPKGTTQITTALIVRTPTEGKPHAE